MTVNIELMNVQNELNAPKGQYHNFGKYSYRSCEDILKAVKPLLFANQATITLNDEVMIVGDRGYVKSTATFISKSGEISVAAFAGEPSMKKMMDESQITGSASSYARKYALNGLLLIDDAKDNDSKSIADTTDDCVKELDYHCDIFLKGIEDAVDSVMLKKSACTFNAVIKKYETTAKEEVKTKRAEVLKKIKEPYMKKLAEVNGGTAI